MENEPAQFDARHVDPRVRLAMRILEFEQTRVPTVNDVAVRVGLSPFHLAHLFAEQVGESCSAYSRRIRLENSNNQLMHDPVPLNVVAGWFGYASQAAYTRAFSRHFGMPPLQYVKTVLGRSQADFAANQLPQDRDIHTRTSLLPQPVTLHRRLDSPAFVRRFYGQNVADHWNRFLSDLPIGFADPARLVGMAYDSPRVTPNARWRYDCGLVFDDATIVHPSRHLPPGLDMVEVPGGLHAETTVHGGFTGGWQAVVGLLTQWLPAHPEYRTEGDPIVHWLQGSPLDASFAITATIRIYPYEKLPSLNLLPLTRYGRPAGYRTPPLLC